MIRVLTVAAALLILTSAAHARWYARSAIVWTWHADRTYRAPHALSRRELDAELCRLTSPKPATGDLYRDVRIVELNCARKYGARVY